MSRKNSNYRVHCLVDNVAKKFDVIANTPKVAASVIRDRVAPKQCIVKKVKIIKEDQVNV